MRGKYRQSSGFLPVPAEGCFQTEEDGIHCGNGCSSIAFSTLPKLSRILLALFMPALFPVASFADKFQSAVIALVFPSGARQNAMGETGVALADDENALFWNPANTHANGSWGVRDNQTGISLTINKFGNWSSKDVEWWRTGE